MQTGRERRGTVKRRSVRHGDGASPRERERWLPRCMDMSEEGRRNPRSTERAGAHAIQTLTAHLQPVSPAPIDRVESIGSTSSNGLDRCVECISKGASTKVSLCAIVDSGRVTLSARRLLASVGLCVITGAGERARGGARCGYPCSTGTC